MNDRNTQFSELCLKNKWRRTPQRQAVFEFMHNNLTHPSVDEVWKNVRKTVSSVTRESVYRILNEFTEAGVITRLDKIESARYDCSTLPHGHFVCERCKKIIDFTLPENFTAPSQFEGSKLFHIELRLAGLCPQCQRAEKSKKAGSAEQQMLNGCQPEKDRTIRK